MILLRFTVRNHKSIRDEVTLDLTNPRFKTLTPRDGDWNSVTYPLAGIFGGNATGKSALLDALIYFFAALRWSSTKWQAREGFPRNPFRLEEGARRSSSMYALEFVHDDRRYEYGFEVDDDGIQQEWLRDVPTTRWRTLLMRDREGDQLRFHPSLGERMTVTPRELVLSRARLLPDSPLHTVAKDLTAYFDFITVKDSHREVRLRHITSSLAKGSIRVSDIEQLLQAADIGIERVGIEEENIPPHVQKAMFGLFKALNRQPNGDDSSSSESSEGAGSLDEEEFSRVTRHLVFTHRGAGEVRGAEDSGEGGNGLHIQDESDGTIAWLAIAVPALKILRSGGLLVVDEIDASLHPHLVELLLEAFATPEINTSHAQLIFTSHESYVLSPLSNIELEPEQIWLTDKTYNGVTELTCLADFPKHPDANIAKRYLTGRYGGVPLLSPSTFRALVAAGEA